jgi:hypothetical protein
MTLLNTIEENSLNNNIILRFLNLKTSGNDKAKTKKFTLKH